MQHIKFLHDVSLIKTELTAMSPKNNKYEPLMQTSVTIPPPSQWFYPKLSQNYRIIMAISKVVLPDKNQSEALCIMQHITIHMCHIIVHVCHINTHVCHITIHVCHILVLINLFTNYLFSYSKNAKLYLLCAGRQETTKHLILKNRAALKILKKKK